METRRTRRSWTVTVPLVIGVVSLVFLCWAVLWWGGTTKISGAVIADGQVLVTTSRTTVQHPTGGVVSDIAVDNGDYVRAGDILVVLEDPALQSELAIVEGELFEVLANEARLHAIIADSETLEPHELLREAALQDPRIQALLDRQSHYLASQFQGLSTQTRLIDEKISQLEEQIAGTRGEISAQRAHLNLAEEGLKDAISNLEKGVVLVRVVQDFQKDVFSASGELAKLEARLAELKGKVSEQRITSTTFAVSLKEKAMESLTRSSLQRVKLLEKRFKLAGEIRKLQVRAPISGFVHESKVMGLRSVIPRAGSLMSIVPDAEPAIVSARVRAVDIDQVFVGQAVQLRFPAFHLRTTPIIEGTVTKISAEAVMDARKKQLIYTVEIGFREEVVEKLGDRELVSGMPVLAFINTEERTPLSYLTKPFMDYVGLALRDS